MDRIMCHNEVSACGLKYLKAAKPVLLMQKGKDTHPHPHP
jgi:hypothetical protein